MLIYYIMSCPPGSKLLADSCIIGSVKVPPYLLNIEVVDILNKRKQALGGMLTRHGVKQTLLEYWFYRDQRLFAKAQKLPEGNGGARRRSKKMRKSHKKSRHARKSHKHRR